MASLMSEVLKLLTIFLSLENTTDQSELPWEVSALAVTADIAMVTSRPNTGSSFHLFLLMLSSSLIQTQYFILNCYPAPPCAPDGILGVVVLNRVHFRLDAELHAVVIVNRLDRRIVPVLAHFLSNLACNHLIDLQCICKWFRYLLCLQNL